MKKYKVSVVGDIGTGEPVYNGQTAKTRDYVYYLSRRYGIENVNSVDTRYWRKKAIIKAGLLLYAMLNSESLVLVLGKNGRRTILPLAVMLKRWTKNQVLFSIVGGSLMYDFDHERKTIFYMGKIEGSFVETKIFKDFLEKKGVPSIYYSPVFSKREGIRSTLTLEQASIKPYRFCTYSRVCKEKGTSSAIDAICDINNQAGKVICELDIYGVPQDNYRDEFEEKIQNANGYVHVYPYLDDTNAIDTLSKHYMMLFPTYYEGEGFPIAIVECYIAGLPVIASNWHFNTEVVLHGQTGLIYQLEVEGTFVKQVLWCINHPDMVYQMKEKCLERALLFEPDKALACIYQKIERK